MNVKWWTNANYLIFDCKVYVLRRLHWWLFIKSVQSLTEIRVPLEEKHQCQNLSAIKPWNLESHVWKTHKDKIIPDVLNMCAETRMLRTELMNSAGNMECSQMN